MSEQAQTPESGREAPAPVEPRTAEAMVNPLVSPDAPAPPVAEPPEADRTQPPGAVRETPPVAAAAAEAHTDRPGSSSPPPLFGGPAAPPLTVSGVPGLVRKLGLPEDRPEVAAGAAFGAGFLFAMILRRLAR